MNCSLQKLLLQIFIVFIATCSAAQQNRLPPEVAQMCRNAQGDISRGDDNEAIIIYKQAIQLEPDNRLLYIDLAKLLYRAGNYTEAEQVTRSLITKPGADAGCYRLLAASEAALKKRKAAKETLQKGISLFPASGLLYHEKGIEDEQDEKPKAALNAWLDGIQYEPGYARNYYEAARMYLGADKVLWGLLYGEMFLDMEHDTTHDETFKDSLYAGYKTMFDHIAGDAPQYGYETGKQPQGTFEDAVTAVYAMLTPVMSDGMSTENLTMVRTRFLMEWFDEYDKKYPFTLFSYQDNLVRNGYFDMCNEWLFGKAENMEQYNAWNRFHAGDLGRFAGWQAGNRLHPAAADFYNDRNMDGLFTKKKR